MNTKIYVDNAATTAVDPYVYEQMKPYLESFYGNPSSVYDVARTSKKALENARAQVAAAICANPSEIYFTSGGTEADNWAIKGVAAANKGKGNHIITSAFEHHAVLHTCEYLEKNGFEVTYVPVSSEGIVNPKDVADAIRPETILITIMYANNEIGTISNIKEIGEIAHKSGVLFHTDAVQAVGTVPINVVEQNIDLLSLSGHKLNAPKGVGALYIRKGVKIAPLIHGGAQEKRKRAGTENIPGIVGLGCAIEQKLAEMETVNKRVYELREMLIDGILSTISHTTLNGSRTSRLPGNVNISFEFIEGESLLLLLDAKGIAASSGSACTSGSLDPSHVLLAIGLPHEQAHGSLRLSIGKYNTKEEMETILKELPAIVQRLRDMSPLYETYLKGKK